MYPAEPAEMDSREEACLDCTKKCFLIHKKKKHSTPNITSFFKVMIGDKFSEILVYLDFYPLFLFIHSFILSSLLFIGFISFFPYPNFWI